MEENLTQPLIVPERPDDFTPPNLISAFGSAAILKHTHAMSAEIEGVRLGQDPEAIHRMRVASRRLRTALQLFPESLPTHRSDEWYKAIRKVASALGNSRDLDVQIISLEEILKTISDRTILPGVRRISLRIHQRRTKMQEDVQKSLDVLERSRVLEAIEKKLSGKIMEGDIENFRTPALFLMSSQSCAKLLAEFLMYKDFIHRPECVTELHQMRIIAKHLRYTLETFSELYADRLNQYLQAIRTTQTLLGDIHDCDVWKLTLPEMVASEKRRTKAYFGTTQPMRRLQAGFQWFLDNRNSHRDETYLTFVKKWDTWESKGFWPALFGILTQQV
jgi:CHAD domain-containing protein